MYSESYRLVYVLWSRCSRSPVHCYCCESVLTIFLTKANYKVSLPSRPSGGVDRRSGELRMPYFHDLILAALRSTKSHVNSHMLTILLVGFTGESHSCYRVVSKFTLLCNTRNLIPMELRKLVIHT